MKDILPEMLNMSSCFPFLKLHKSMYKTHNIGMNSMVKFKKKVMPASEHVIKLYQEFTQVVKGRGK